MRSSSNRSERKPAASKIRYATHVDDGDLKAISRLLFKAGMRRRKPQQLRRAIDQSSRVIVAFEGSVVVGFGRMISDSTYYGSIWDVAVLESHQKRGIGSSLIQKLIQHAKKNNLYMLGLFTAPTNRRFYERQGLAYLRDVHAMTIAL